MPGLRPLAFGEILDASFNLLGRQWRTLAAITLAVASPAIAISTLIVFALAPEQFDLEATQSPLLALTEPGQGGVLAAIGGARLLEVAATTLAMMACLQVVGRAYAGRESDARGALAFALPRLPRAVGLVVVAGIGVGLGLLLIVPGIWLGTVWSLALPALLLERLGVLRALARSQEIVRGRFWTVLGLLALSLAMVLLISVLLAALIGGFAAIVAGDSEASGAAAAFVAGVGSVVVTAPLLSAVLMVLYVDQRVRAERFDLEDLARCVGGGAGAPPPRSQAGLGERPGELPSGWLPPSPPPGAK
jgi:hypothetical protein